MAVVGLAGVAACSSASPPQTKASTGATRSTSAALTASEQLTAALFPTGVDSNNDLLADQAQDQHYTATTQDGNCEPGAPFVVTKASAPGVLPNTWIDPPAADPPVAAQWISCSLNAWGVDDPGKGIDNTYLYETKLTVPPGVPPSSISVTGRWACDDFCTIKVNNVALDPDIISKTESGAYGSLDQFTIPAQVSPGGPNTFLPGENTITFVVEDTGGQEGLLVSDITVTGGCTADADCGGNGNTCDTDTNLCTLYKNGDGNCSTIDTDANNAATVCATGVCGSDGKCGLAPGDACTQDTATQCRSGVCTNQGACQAPNDCNADGACDDTSKYCDTGTNKCLPKQPNGEGSSCTVENGPTVCQSEACDDNDHKCGLADSTQCIADNPAACRSGGCSANGTCMPSGGCNINDDCTNASQPVCDTGTHQCVESSVVVPDTDSGTPEPTNDAGTNASTATTGGGGGGSSCSVPAGANHGAGFGSVAGVTAIALAGLIRRRRSSR